MNNVSPINYELEFEPDFKKFTFKGKEKVSVKISRPTNKITLHSAELEIIQCEISCNGKETRPKIKLDEKSEEVTFSFSQKISGKAIISIDFIGQLNDKLVGF